jgi:hypothetical protein
VGVEPAIVLLMLLDSLPEILGTGPTIDWVFSEISRPEMACQLGSSKEVTSGAFPGCPYFYHGSDFGYLLSMSFFHSGCFV